MDRPINSYLHIAFCAVLLLNTLWFGLGFHYFSLAQWAAAKLLVAREHRESPVFPALANALRFLGGMNLALCLLAALLLISRNWFPEARQCALFTSVFAVAHGSQFAFNLPVLRGGQRLWLVLSGPMLFIFVVDGTLTVANAVLAGLFLGL